MANDPNQSSTKLANQIRSPIRRAVIDDNNLVPHSGERILQAADQFLDGGQFIECGHHDRDEWTLSSHSSLALFRLTRIVLPQTNALRSTVAEPKIVYIHRTNLLCSR